MSIHIGRRFLLALLFLAVSGAVWWLAGQSGPPAQAGEGVFHLKPPAFIGRAQAETISTQDIAGEAGMSAYFKSSFSVNLNDVRDAFRTIEDETSDYIIGSVPVTNYPENQDVHVYVHRDGWFMAYYLEADPVGKIFDWRAYHDGGRVNISTKLENTLAVMASEANVPLGSVTYYHFRYPDATNMMLVVEWAYESGDSFEINLPGNYAYSERSWSLGSDGYSTLRLDGTQIAGNSGVWSVNGKFSAAQMLTDQFHTIEVNDGTYTSYGYGGLALIYRVP